MGKQTSLADTVADFLERFPAATYLGLAPLFTESKVVSGPSSDWILVPSGADPQVKLDMLHAPRRAKLKLRQLATSKAPVAALYVAHEVPVGAKKRLEHHGLEKELQTSPEAKNLALARRLDKVGKAMTTAMTAAASAPLLAAGALASIASAGLDPDVLAAVTASGTAHQGEQAAWFHIVSWI